MERIICDKATSLNPAHSGHLLRMKIIWTLPHNVFAGQHIRLLWDVRVFCLRLTRSSFGPTNSGQFTSHLKPWTVDLLCYEMATSEGSTSQALPEHTCQLGTVWRSNPWPCAGDLAQVISANTAGPYSGHSFCLSWAARRPVPERADSLDMSGYQSGQKHCLGNGSEELRTAVGSGLLEAMDG